MGLFKQYVVSEVEMLRMQAHNIPVASKVRP